MFVSVQHGMCVENLSFDLLVFTSQNNTYVARKLDKPKNVAYFCFTNYLRPQI